MAEQQKLRLHYFDLYGRAEVLRLAFWYAKMEYEDIRFSNEEFDELKASGKLPFGQVPVLELDGKYYGQTIPILRWICQKNNLYPSDIDQIYHVEVAWEIVNDIM